MQPTRWIALCKKRTIFRGSGSKFKPERPKKLLSICTCYCIRQNKWVMIVFEIYNRCSWIRAKTEQIHLQLLRLRHYLIVKEHSYIYGHLKYDAMYQYFKTSVLQMEAEYIYIYIYISCKMGTGSFPGVKCGRGVLLTTHPF